jgi:alkanesulfonate monooxygenase SsuD/methylene tetrahydromethanopterin reductase-like flavin-dependent oxidoreductase (luciferase family)
MKLSTYLPYTGQLSLPDTLVAFARAVESVGYTWVRGGEHILYPKKTSSRYPYAPQGTRVVDVNSNQLELFSVFSYLAGQTMTLRFQSGVLPLRSPFDTARSTATGHTPTAERYHHDSL